MARLHHWCFDLKTGNILESQRFDDKDKAENQARIWLTAKIQQELAVIEKDPVTEDMAKELAEAFECLWGLEEGDFKRAVTLWNHYAARVIGLPEVFVRRCRTPAGSP